MKMTHLEHPKRLAPKLLTLTALVLGLCLAPLVSAAPPVWNGIDQCTYGGRAQAGMDCNSIVPDVDLLPEPAPVEPVVPPIVDPIDFYPPVYYPYDPVVHCVKLDPFSRLVSCWFESNPIGR